MEYQCNTTVIMFMQQDDMASALLNKKIDPEIQGALPHAVLSSVIVFKDRRFFFNPHTGGDGQGHQPN